MTVAASSSNSSYNRMLVVQAAAVKEGTSLTDNPAFKEYDPVLMHVQQKRLPSSVLQSLYDRLCRSIPGSEGKSLSLDSLIGKQALVAFFYPKVTLLFCGTSLSMHYGSCLYLKSSIAPNNLRQPMGKICISCYKVPIELSLPMSKPCMCGILPSAGFQLCQRAWPNTSYQPAASPRA